jgi:hypothetical protein
MADHLYITQLHHQAQYLCHLHSRCEAVLHKLLLSGLQASKVRAIQKTSRLEARMGADVAEQSRLEAKVATDLQALSTGEQQRLQEQLAEAKFR